MRRSSWSMSRSGLTSPARGRAGSKREAERLAAAALLERLVSES